MKRKKKLELFIGPCVLESEQLAIDIAGFLKESLAPFADRVALHFKGSFDKANRTSIDSYRGPGLEKGLKILEKVKRDIGLPVITDFHFQKQAQAVAQVVDVLQVPAFLCRQTDIVVAGAKACAQYEKKLNLKKGQFLAPEEAEHIVLKACHYLPKSSLYLTERGTSFGYNNLVVDMASFGIMKKFGVKTIHDATHCVQRPGGEGKSTGGKREQVEVLAKAAMAAGADGVFIECHPNPDEALSDKTTCLEMAKIPALISTLLKIYEVV